MSRGAYATPLATLPLDTTPFILAHEAVAGIILLETIRPKFAVPPSLASRETTAPKVGPDDELKTLPSRLAIGLYPPQSGEDRK